MTSLPWYVIPRRAAFFLGVAAISLSPAPSQAQQTPPLTPTETTAPVSAEVFPYELGHATRAGSVYSISATQPLTSALKGQKLRLKIVDAVTTGTDTRFFTLATGKYKTVAQLDVFLVDVFRRFLATPSPAPNQDLGKIGDVRYGGEVHFIVVSPHDLRFDNLAPDEPARASHYSRSDVEALLSILTGTPPPP